MKKAKTIVLYCNSYRCDQTPAMVKNAEFTLLKIDYPSEKIKYYKGVFNLGLVLDSQLLVML